MKLALREVGRVLCVDVESDAIVTGWSVDSRTVEPGDLFFALRGPNHDGNAYVEAAFERSSCRCNRTHRSGDLCHNGWGQ